MNQEGVVRPLALPDLTVRAAAARGPGADPAAQAVREGQRIAGAIIARAQAHAAEVAAHAEARGRAEGRRHAFQEEGRALREAAAALREGAACLAAARDDLRHRLAQALPALVLEVAGRLLGRELSLRPETLAELIREGLGVVGPAERVVLRVHPEDAATLERYREVLGLEGAAARIEPAPEVGRGGCVIETDTLTLGAGLPQRLEAALELLGGAPPA